MSSDSLRILVWAMAVGLVAGCLGGGQGTSSRVKVYKASGKVTYLGSPLIGAAVTFAPQDQQPAAVGRTNDLGEFVLSTYGGGDGAAAGTFKVLVTLPVTPDAPPQEMHSPDGTNLPETHSASSAKASGNVLPAQYGDLGQTPLKATVEPGGTNRFTFELTN